jgi:signal peptide peptidase SppA
MNRSYVYEAFVGTPWAILPSKLVVLEEIVTRHMTGEKLSAEEVQMRIHGSTRPQDQRIESVAILRLFGTIVPRASMMTDISGATSAERFSFQFSELVNDPDVGAIILDVNSPGGQASGIAEAANIIHAARGRKPIIAVANHLMASAAYWIGTAADEIVVTPSAEVGSIGVFSAHSDYSAYLEKEGVKVSIIKAGKYKAEGNPYEPLNDEARANIQQSVDEIYDSFVNAVARNRGMKPSHVRSEFGEGRVVSARRAVDLGMADRIGTLQETIQSLLQNGNSTSNKAPQSISENVPPELLNLSSEPQETEADVQRAANLERLRERIKTQS